MDEDCEHNYYWCQMLEEFEQIRLLIKIIKDSYNQNECNCNCNCEKEPVFCVKNYSV